MATSFFTATPFVFILLLSISSITVHGASHHHTAAPAPAVDCSTLIINMADCLDFVTAGGTSAKPKSSCCAGLKTVLKADAECLCEAFKNSASFGITLNMTKAATLPTACKLHAPSISNCGLSMTPTMAPGLAPGGAVAAGPGAAGPGAAGPGAAGPGAAGPGAAGPGAAGPGAAGTTIAPTPSQGNDGSSLIPISFTTLFSALFFVLFSSRV